MAYFNGGSSGGAIDIMALKGRIFSVIQVKHKWLLNRWLVVDPCFSSKHETIGSLAYEAIQKNGKVTKEKMNGNELTYHMEFENNHRLHIKLFPYDEKEDR